MGDLISWFTGTVLPWITGSFYAWMKSQVVKAINNKITETKNFLNQIYREGASIFNNAVLKARVFGGMDVGSGGYAYIEDIVRATIETVNSGAPAPAFSLFSSYSNLPSDNDAFVYFDTNGDQSLMDLAKDLSQKAESDNLGSAVKWLGQHSPYAPTTLSLGDAGGDLNKIKRNLTRYTRSLVGDPLEIESEMKGIDPALGRYYLQETIRANAQKRLAVDVASEAAADICYAISLEKKLKDFEDTPRTASLTTAIKDLNRLIVLQTHVNTKILKQLAQQSLVDAEQAATLGEQRAIGAGRVARRAQVR